jgi:hypothetical protein
MEIIEGHGVIGDDLEMIHAREHRSQAFVHHLLSLSDGYCLIAFVQETAEK